MPEPLEARLRALAADAVWPDTPDLAAAVMAGAADARRPRRPVHSRRLAAALLAALLLLPAAGAVAFPAARDDVLDWLGLRNVTVRRVPATPPGARAELEDDLGGLTTLAGARRRAGFGAAVPAALGAADRVRADDRRISLIYDPRPGLPALDGVRAGAIVTESRGGIRGEFLRKLVSTGTSVERVAVHGRHGAFISGGTHAYVYETPGGDIREERPLLAGPTLIWEGRGRVFRLEARAGRRAALRIARSVP